MTKKIKELTPLEALERLTKIHNYETFNECYKIVENALKDYLVYKQDYERVMKEKNSLLKECAKSQKKLKALEIIKAKKVDAVVLMESVSLYDYNDYMNSSHMYNQYGNSRQLTQEEYDLLKEVLS